MTTSTSMGRGEELGRGRKIHREVIEFCREQPRTLSFFQIADLAAERFGADRAPTPWQIAADHLKRVPHNPRAGHWQRDGEIVQFIAGYAGRLSHDEIRAAALKHFAPARVPSRSSIGRFVQAFRARLIESPDLVLRKRR